MTGLGMEGLSHPGQAHQGSYGWTLTGWTTGVRMATIEPLQQHDIDFAIEKGDVDTFVVAFTDVQGRLRGERLTALHFMSDVLAHGMAVPSHLLGVQPRVASPDAEAPLWETGFGDIVLRPDPTAYFRMAWQPSSVGILCDVTLLDGSPLPFSPRWVLRRILQKVDAAGYSSFVGAAPAFRVFREPTLDGRRSYSGLTPATPTASDSALISSAPAEPLLARIRREMAQVPMPIEGTAASRAAGQFVVALSESDPVTTADRLAVLKNSMKVAANQEGHSITFMGRYDDEPGNCSHLDVTLRGSRGNAPLADRYGDNGLSEIGRAFVSGLVMHAPEVMLLYAPTPNSYRRFSNDPFAPSNLSWGADNRSCAFRTKGNDANLRIENRVAGSDSNPYLAIAAMLASGLDGIIHKLQAGPAAVGSAHKSDGPPIPAGLEDAVRLWESSTWVSETFGAEVQEQYATQARAELTAARYSTEDPWDWERNRYFDSY